MPDWVLGVLFLGGIFGAVYAWEVAKEKARSKGGKLAQAADLAEAAGEFTGGAFHSLLQKGGGLLMAALAAFLLWSLGKEFNFLILLIALAVAAYAVYLLWPGRRSFFIFF